MKFKYYNYSSLFLALGVFFTSLFSAHLFACEENLTIEGSQALLRERVSHEFDGALVEHDISRVSFGKEGGVLVDGKLSHAWDHFPLKSYATAVRSLENHGAVWSPHDGADKLQKLKEINDFLIEADAEDFEAFVKKMGLLVEDDSVVREQGSAQNEPLKIWHFPMAYTGIYVPKKTKKQNYSFNPEVHEAVTIFIPGIGGTRSVALGVRGVALGFSKTKSFYIPTESEIAHAESKGKPRPQIKKVPEFGDTDKKRGFRAYSVLFDPPLNGLGSGAPGVFGSAEGVLESLRHVQIILSRIYKVPIVLAGRSQGGIVTKAFLSKFEKAPYPVAVGIGMNSTPHLTENFEPDSVRETFVDEKGKLQIRSQMNTAAHTSILHPRAWASYLWATPGYFDLATAGFETPYLELRGTEDSSYDQSSYGVMVEAFAGERENRSIFNYPGSHNGWHNDKKNPENYSDILSAMTQFIQRSLKQ